MALVFILSPLPLFLFILSLLSLSLFAKRNGGTKLNLPPGPRKLPLIGNLHQLDTLMHRSLHRLSLKHGPLMYLQLGRVPAVVISSSAMAKEILKNHDNESCNRPSHVAWEKLSYGNSDIAFAGYSDPWRFLRKLCMVELLGTKMVDSFQSVRQEEVMKSMEIIASKARERAKIDLSEEMFVLASNIICRLAFGRSYRDVRHEVKDILYETEAMFISFFVADYLPALRWVDAITGLNSRLENVFVKLDRFYQRIIDEHLDRMQREEEKDKDICSENLAGALLRVQRDEGSVTFDQIKGVLMNIFIGGTDTSSATLEWAMTELVRHPEVMKKAQGEVRRIIGRKGSVEESDLHQLHYLKCILKETLRLHLAVPMIVPREALQHFKIEQYDIPARMTIFINYWVIARDPGYWDMPEEFHPDRYMDVSSDFKGNDNFNFIPFGEGRRICPGKNFALKAMELELANLLYSFDWGLPDRMTAENIDMSEASGFSVHRKSPLCLVPTIYGIGQ